MDQKKHELDKRLRQSAVSARNRGSIFVFDEFKKIATTRYTRESGLIFPTWLSRRFMANSLCFGALRTEQFVRFRQGGLKSIDETNRDHKGCLRPLATSVYSRVKPRTGATPNALDSDFELTFPCLCKGNHEPIEHYPG